MLTEQQQNDILDHVLVDRAAWEENAVATMGEEKAAQAKLAKALRWKASYDAARAEGKYLPRAQRKEHEPALKA